MSSYTCPDCTDGSLEAKVREVDLELEEGETAQIVGGVVLVTSVGCDNGCSEEKPKTQKRNRTAAHAGEQCARSAKCDKPNGHQYRCNSNRSEASAE